MRREHDEIRPLLLCDGGNRVCNEAISHHRVGIKSFCLE
jgi:hypothetical protein